MSRLITIPNFGDPAGGVMGVPGQSGVPGGVTVVDSGAPFR
jgi:hypothetical protein